MPMAQYSVIKKEQIIDMQKILGRLQDIMQIEKNSKFHISYDSMDITVLKLQRQKMISFCQYTNMVRDVRGCDYKGLTLGGVLQ